MKNRILLLPVLLLALWSCNPNDDDGSSATDEQFAENFGAAASRDFIGQVVDMDNHAIVGATVTIGSNSVQSDANGVFVINGANVREKFAYVKATKAGFLDGSSSMVPTSGKNNVKIMLIRARRGAVLSAAATAVVDVPNDTKSTFQGAFKYKHGNTYSGNVNVSMFHLEASNENISNLMPGMLYAKGQDGEAKVLQTFGMLNVELRGSAEQKLNIADGHKADISMKIDDSQSATAPSSIPLWHFDDAVGYWKQDGTATKQGNFYVGEVSHFSWWNCDDFTSAVTLTITVQDSSGTPIANVGVGLTNAGGVVSNIGISNINGQVSGMIPANQTLVLTVYDFCGSVITTVTIGPFSTDIALPPITINLGTTQMSRISGAFKKCDDTLVENGYVYFSYGDKNIATPVVNGNFDFYSVVCDNLNFELQGVDFDNIQSTGPIGYVFRFPETKVGSLKACNTATEFIQYRVDNNPMVTITTGIEAGFSPNFELNAFSTIGEGYLAMGAFAAITAPGTYTTSTFQGQGTSLGEFGVFYILNQNPNTMVFNVNKIGSVGGYVDITFEGTFPHGSDGPLQTITGVIHVKRDN
jgi:hypothetical protein